jgi:hypothetical protein
MVAGVCALGHSAPALAQPKPPKAAAAKEAKPLTEAQKKALAKKSYKDGEAKFKDGKYQEALEQYKIADDVLPVPQTKYKMAVCQDKLGHVVDAVAGYQTFLDSSPNPEKLADSIADAKSRMDALMKTPGKVRVAVTPADAPKLTITLDAGQPQAAGSLPVENVAPKSANPDAPPAAPVARRTIVMPPGHHKLAISADGFDQGATEFDLPFAGTKDLDVTLNKAAPPMPPPPVAAATDTPPPPPPPPPPAPRSNVPAYVTLGLAGAGVVVGTAFGVLALQSKSKFNTTPTTDNADTTDRNALISDMSFAVALTFGVTGLVLLLSNDTAAEPAKTGQVQKTKKSPLRGFVTPYAGPNGGGAVGVIRF